VQMRIRNLIDLRMEVIGKDLPPTSAVHVEVLARYLGLPFVPLR
jgi:hypothetical protein